MLATLTIGKLAKLGQVNRGDDQANRTGWEFGWDARLHAMLVIDIGDQLYGFHG